MTAIGIIGAAGRMGRAIADAAIVQGVTIAGGIDRDAVVHGDHPEAGALARASDVLIDFSSPQALPANLAAARDAGTPIVIGTTGLAPADHALIDAAAAHVAVLQTANTSIGVNVLRRLVEEAARRLGPEWDIEIVEMHHRHKVDAPSGTALLLGRSANIGRGAADGRALDRLERDGAREEGGIYYASLRGGSVAGDHQVVFATEGERIELGHRAENRGIFATGALKAALWLAGKPAGRYTMDGRARPVKKADVALFYRRLQEAMPEPETELRYRNPYTLLVAVALSAQATDVSVNKATGPLFEVADDPAAMVALGEERLRGYIKTIGLFNTKARNVIALSEMLLRDFGGTVPADRDALEKLPGVGRKTANVVMNVAFGAETIAVDTHIFRVGNRTGLAPGKDPLAVELKLEKVTPKPYRRHAHHWLILHGRYVCKARTPECWRCPVEDLCAYKPKTPAPASTRSAVRALEP